MHGALRVFYIIYGLYYCWYMVIACYKPASCSNLEHNQNDIFSSLCVYTTPCFHNIISRWGWTILDYILLTIIHHVDLVLYLYSPERDWQDNEYFAKTIIVYAQLNEDQHLFCRNFIRSSDKSNVAFTKLELKDRH